MSQKTQVGTVSFKKRDEAVNIEPEAPVNPATYATLTTPSNQFTDISGEDYFGDTGGPPKIKLIQGASSENGRIPIGHFALVDAASDAHDLGTSFQFVPLHLDLYWMADYGQLDGAAPVKFATVEEVVAFGGSIDIRPVPSKIKFSRAATLLLTLPTPDSLPSGIPKVAISKKPYTPALWYLSRSSFRLLGTGLVSHTKFSKEALCERTFKAESRQETQRGGTNRYFVPVLRTSDEEKHSSRLVAEFRLLTSTIGIPLTPAPALEN